MSLHPQLTKQVLGEVAAERTRQDFQFGEQNLTPFEWLAVLNEEMGEVAQELCNLLVCEKRGFKIGEQLVIYGNYRKELIQVAAVVVSMVECLDRASSRIETNGDRTA